MDNPEIWIALVIVGFLIFGAKRMPDAARGLGRSLRIFKAETKGLLTDEPVATQPPAVARRPGGGTCTRRGTRAGSARSGGPAARRAVVRAG
jgi:sec-independent protein translocase protein TatA